MLKTLFWVVVIGALVYFGNNWWQNRSQSVEPVLERGILERAMFCGESYTVQKLTIRGINIPERIAALATRQLSGELCEEVKGAAVNGHLSVSAISDPNEPRQYTVILGRLRFLVDFTQNRIWRNSPGVGNLLGPIN